MLKRSSFLVGVFLLIPGIALADFNPFKAAKELADAVEKANRGKDAGKRDQGAPRAAPQATPAVSLGAGRTISYAGYSKAFLPIKRQMLSGDLDGAVSRFEKKEVKSRKKAKGNELEYYQNVGFLDFVEGGTLDLSRGDFAGSIEAYNGAEQVLNLRNNESKTKEKGKAFLGRFGGIVLGKDEFVPYYGVGFERILMLNGKTIAYLLGGDRLAYNVTRRSIDWQNTERADFDAEQRRIQEDLAKKKGEKSGLYDVVQKMVWASYADFEAKAQEVPSAFVNPFGYYVAGMIQEFESSNDPGLIDNARISYGKALELNPNSPVIKQAYEAMKKREKAGKKRLVHIVAFDGFTPEKKMLEFKMRASADIVVPVKLPVYQPVDSLVSRLKVTGNGKPLSGLDEVASVESISLRYQSDRRPKQTLDVLIAVGASVGKRVAAGNNALARAAVQMHESLMSPDMRSWMSLPSTISAARFYAPKGVQTIEVHSYDDAGRKLATKSVELAESGPTFIFVRSMDTQLHAYANQGLWLN